MPKNKALLFLAFLTFTLSSCGPKTTVSTTSSSSPTESQPTVNMSTWTDPAGFTFSYPSSITIDDNPDDQDNYANLEIGQVRIIMQDNKFSDLTSWANNSKAVDTVLGDKEALKIQTADKILLGAIDNDVLVTITAPIQEEKLFNQIVSSFEFFYPTPTATKQSKIQAQPPSDNVLEEE